MTKNHQKQWLIDVNGVASLPQKVKLLCPRQVCQGAIAMFPEPSVSWQFTSKLRWPYVNALRISLRLEGHRVIPARFARLKAPRGVPSAIHKHEEKRMHTMQVSEKTERIPGKDSLR